MPDRLLCYHILNADVDINVTNGASMNASAITVLNGGQIYKR